MFNHLEQELQNKPFLTRKEEIIPHLSKLLVAAVKTHQPHLLGLSGGVDSALLAKLSSSAQLVTVGLENSSDLKEARKLAQHMKWEVESSIITPEQAEKLIAEVKMDNLPSNKLFLAFGFYKVKEDVKNGSPYSRYEFNVK